MSMSGVPGIRKVAQQEALIGRTLQKGEYVIEAVLGHGGMGQVFLASHAQVDVPVAIKQVRADEPLPPSVIEELDLLLHSKSTPTLPLRGEFPLSGGTNTDRFLREALLLARLRHPAIPLLYDYFLENGHWYLVMEYVPGSTLSTYMREHAPLPPLEAINYALQICDVLDYLHQQNPPVVFRDLKPANIILHPDGRLMVVDFGIARYFKEGQYNDTTDFGSPGYASPEQYEGIGQTDARSDLFSLGVIIHEMLSGPRPTRRDVSLEQLESLHKLNPGISPALSGLVMVATRAEPMYRFQSAHTFYQALERVRSVEERRSYRYHTLIAEVSAAQKTPLFPMLIPPPSSQGFLSSELAREQDQRAQHMRMREHQPRNMVRTSLEQEALAHQLTSIDESLKLRAISAPLGQVSASPAVLPAPPPASLVDAPTFQPRIADEIEETPRMPPPPGPPVIPGSPLSRPVPRKHGKARFILSLCLLTLFVVSSILAYRYLFAHTKTLTPAPRPRELPTATPLILPTATPTASVSRWQTLPSLPSPEADNTALYVTYQGQDFIYMTGGYRGPQETPAYSQGLYRYSIASGQWDNLNLVDLPMMGNNAAVSDGQGDLFFSGGYSPVQGTISPHLYEYQLATSTLRVIYVPNNLLLGFGVSLVSDQQGHIYMNEGFLTPGNANALAGQGWYRYDIASGEWQNMASLPLGLGYVQLTLDGQGHILLIGGARDAGQSQPGTAIYLYNIQQNTWSQSPVTLPSPLSGSESCTDGQGHLVVIGGYLSLADRSLDTVWELNLQTFQWQSLPALPDGGSELGTASCDGQGHVYVTRGANNPARPTADFLELTLPNQNATIQTATP